MMIPMHTEAKQLGNRLETHSGCSLQDKDSKKTKIPEQYATGLRRKLQASLEFRSRYLFRDDMIYILQQPRSLTQ